MVWCNYGKFSGIFSRCKQTKLLYFLSPGQLLVIYRLESFDGRLSMKKLFCSWSVCISLNCFLLTELWAFWCLKVICFVVITLGACLLTFTTILSYCCSFVNFFYWYWFGFLVLLYLYYWYLIFSFGSWMVCWGSEILYAYDKLKPSTFY